MQRMTIAVYVIANKRKTALLEVDFRTLSGIIGIGTKASRRSGFRIVKVIKTLDFYCSFLFLALLQVPKLQKTTSSATHLQKKHNI
jgi:hypothetical protein